MNLLYLGTGSAEGIPALFCQCDNCQNVWENGSSEDYRARTQALINQDLLIDFSPDTFMNQQRFADFNLSEINYLLITHTHSDHLIVSELAQISEISRKRPLKVYGNQKVMDKLSSENSNLEFHYLAPFETYQIGPYQITPLLANHSSNEESYLYLIKEQEELLFYAHDTGILPEITMNYLCQLPCEITTISIDANELYDGINSTHMTIPQIEDVVSSLKQAQVIASDFQIYLSHFSHNEYVMHHDLVKQLEHTKLKIAYDGLSLSI